MRKKKLVDKLIEECTETDDEVKMARITLAEYENECETSCTLYIVLFSVFLTVSIGIALFSFIFIGTQKVKALVVLILTLIY